MKCLAVNHQSYYKLGGVVPLQIYKRNDTISIIFVLTIIEKNIYLFGQLKINIKYFNVCYDHWYEKSKYKK